MVEEEGVDLQIEAHQGDQRACQGVGARPMTGKSGIPPLKRGDKVEGILTRMEDAKKALNVGREVAPEQKIWVPVIPGLPPLLRSKKGLLVVNKRLVLSKLGCVDKLVSGSDGESGQ